jgi:phospholipid/cholesterol/gamma-HCH transport system substrate-binding protein
MKATRLSAWSVGLFVLLALVAGGSFVGLRVAREYWLDRPWRVDLVMSRGYGLRAGNPVKLNGVTVGAVDAVDVEPDGRVRAVLGVKRRYRRHLTDRTTFRAREPFVLGDSWVEMTVKEGRGARMRERAEVEIPEAEEGLGELGIAREDVQEMVGTARTLLADVSAIVRQAREGEGSLGRLVKDAALYDELTRALAQSTDVMTHALDPRTSMGKLLTEATFYEELTAVTTEMKESLIALRGQRDQASEAVQRLNQLLVDADQAVVGIETLVRKINEGEGTIGKFATDPGIYDETRKILAEVRETVEDLREQSPISTFVGAVLAAF